MSKKIFVALCLVGLLGACGGGEGARYPAASILLQAKAERAREEGALPGVSIVAVAGNAIDVASAGTRMAGSTAPLLATDALQAGSQTKALTAMLLARLVEQGKLRWDSTLAELFPAWHDTMQPALRAVTVEQLLRHRAGLKRDPDDAAADELRLLLTGDPVADRAAVAHYMLRQPPEHVPGSTFLYSNTGYLVAGLIAETVGGAPFETLMQDEVFAPLGITASFGFPEDAGSGTVHGHEWRAGGWQSAGYPAEDRYNMGRIGAAAGGLMISMPEYGKLLREHLRGLQGKSTYLRQETFARLHGPAGEYGLGWDVTEVPGHGVVSAHAGSWGSYYVFAILVPQSNRAVAVACNCYGPAAVEQLDELTRRLALAP
ncbi:serine hydrolase domain-containing protein [Pseudoduganella plicata]|uniref:Serine hydrolase n=1 Tax=Pseudoduganella plicata TaxID=321984 RepID=A0A4P7BJ04_9BURK|nr:serine hydrolase domain-containing protein [Pseudoduganella plicata]QBQ38390.1 class A beta-lactamase-related serine hydrolase [Pseudoduganella plicata]GGY81713.1 serine hydrolase [Pseudoduganella plicata]